MSRPDFLTRSLAWRIGRLEQSPLARTHARTVRASQALCGPPILFLPVYPDARDDLAHAGETTWRRAVDEDPEAFRRRVLADWRMASPEVHTGVRFGPTFGERP